MLTGDSNTLGCWEFVSESLVPIISSYVPNCSLILQWWALSEWELPKEKLRQAGPRSFTDFDLHPEAAEPCSIFFKQRGKTFEGGRGGIAVRERHRGLPFIS